ncbi:rRNA maturation RNase YbeY [Candidatus Neomarinimicrobiota bacterium]
MISILVDSIPSIEISYNQGIIKSLLTAVFTKERIAAADLNLIFCDDEFLSDMKKRFFGVSQWTDVIAFRLNDEDKSNIEGEIYISLPRVIDNAATYNEPVKKELARVIIHGGLHLIGYDDIEESDKTIMRGRELEFLEQFDWNSL